jgi:HSP20 family molecular chaperone IbpA
VKIDAEKVTANVKDGVLTITLAKAPEARPRQITVRAAS